MNRELLTKIRDRVATLGQYNTIDGEPSEFNIGPWKSKGIVKGQCGYQACAIGHCLDFLPHKINSIGHIDQKELEAVLEMDTETFDFMFKRLAYPLWKVTPEHVVKHIDFVLSKDWNPNKVETEFYYAYIKGRITFEEFKNGNVDA